MSAAASGRTGCPLSPNAVSRSAPHTSTERTARSRAHTRRLPVVDARLARMRLEPCWESSVVVTATLPLSRTDSIQPCLSRRSQVTHTSDRVWNRVDVPTTRSLAGSTAALRATPTGRRASWPRARGASSTWSPLRSEPSRCQTPVVRPGGEPPRWRVPVWSRQRPPTGPGCRRQPGPHGPAMARRRRVPA